MGVCGCVGVCTLEGDVKCVASVSGDNKVRKSLICCRHLLECKLMGTGFLSSLHSPQ